MADIQGTFAQIDKIKKQIAQLRRDSEKSTEEYKAKVLEQAERMRAIQFNCGHWFKSVHTDPAGQAAPQECCDICGFEFS